MEVNNLYLQFLIQLLNNEENIEIENIKEELIVNLYLTLLSLSNIEYSEDIDQKEKAIINDFLRKFNNLKVKIQLKRKPEETSKLAEELINQYYENINILSTYINDGIELENVINTMDAKSLTRLIDTVTKDKMNKEYTKEERNIKRNEIIKLLPSNEYYIENSIIYMKKENEYYEVSVEEFTEMFGYLLNPDNYKKTYTDKPKQIAHKLVIANIIKILLIKDIKKEELDKISIPLALTYLFNDDIEEYYYLDTSKFNIENILISELYSLAAKERESISSNNTPKWRNISIPNEYLLEKLKDMINKGMYYYIDDNFTLDHIDKNISDFKTSISTKELKELLKTMLENKITNNYSKKNIK